VQVSFTGSRKGGTDKKKKGCSTLSRLRFGGKNGRQGLEALNTGEKTSWIDGVSIKKKLESGGSKGLELGEMKREGSQIEEIGPKVVGKKAKRKKGFREGVRHKRRVFCARTGGEAGSWGAPCCVLGKRGAGTKEEDPPRV